MTTIQPNQTPNLVAGSFKQAFKAWMRPEKPALVVPKNDFGKARRNAMIGLVAVTLIDVVVIALSVMANLQAAGDQGLNLGTAFALAAPVLLGAGVTIWHFTHEMLYGWLSRLVTFGLFVMATGCAVVSFGHIQDVVIEEMHASPRDAIIIPLLIDGAALIMAATATAILNYKKRIDIAELEYEAMVERNESANEKRSKTRAANEKVREAKKAVEGDFTLEALQKVLTADPGLSNKAIAEQFGVSARTVANRKKQLNGVELKVVR